MLGKHLLGIYEKALPPELAWKDRLAAAGALGFDFVEISIDESDERLARLDWSVSERLDLVKVIAETGVYIPSMCFSGHRRFPFGSADPAVRSRARSLMEKAVHFARDTGIRIIQLAGYDVYYEPSTRESLCFFEDGLHFACELAEKYQVMLAMEIMDTPLMSSISRYMEYKKKLPSPWLKVYPDLGNLTAWRNDVPTELTLGMRSGEIVAVHVKETLAVTDSFKGQFKCVSFGTGCVDFAANFSLLERLCYRGPYMIELWYDEKSDWQKEIADARRFVETEFLRGTAT